MDPLTEQQLDISFAQGLLEGWVDGEKEPTRTTLRENLKQLTDGIDMYRTSLQTVKTDYALLLERYNNLTSLSAQYLGLISELRQQNQDLLIETQREFHTERE